MQRTIQKKNNYHPEDEIFLEKASPFKEEKKPDAIFCGDLHLREDTPICWIRPDDFQYEQWASLDFISNLQRQYDCPVFCSGDIFDRWKSSPWLLSQTMNHLPAKFFSVYGNHDLPQHSLSLADKSGLHTLVQSGKIKLLAGCHYGDEPDEANAILIKGKKLLVWHHMVFHHEKPYPDCPSQYSATLMIRKYPQYDVLLFGDNHKSFHVTYGNQILVNPGSLTRQTADQIDFQPRVALWYAETNTIEWVNIPILQNAITREHIEVKKERDERIEAFISRLNDDWHVELSFENNLENFFAVNKIDDKVKNIIYKTLS